MALLGLLSLGGCGPVPRPFAQTAAPPLISDHDALRPIQVKAIDGMPGLAELVAAALVKDELAASVQEGGNRYLQLRGQVEAPSILRRLRWQLMSPDGEELGRFQQSLATRSLDQTYQRELAQACARQVARLLRGEDGGQEDLERRPAILLMPIEIIGKFDDKALFRAMQDALASVGLKPVEQAPSYRLQGRLRVTRQEGPKDLVEVDWRLLDGAGREIATLSQASPVSHEQLDGLPGPLARQIAGAGAEGIFEAIRQYRASP
ncbi:MAG TPA: hypothetical protein HPP80_01760 [Rhodospirillaceae bacterium]|nr:hypothetical protein [Rhodospirillaceae bacterium]